MRRSVLSSMIVALVAGVGAPVAAQTSWERPGQPDRRVGLWVGEESEASGIVDRRLESRTEGGDRVVVRGGAVAVSDSPDDTGDIPVSSERGREVYFYEGPDEALEVLEPRVEFGLEVSHRWTGRPEAARALFETAIFVVRAHRDLEAFEEARGWMRRIVEGLPAHRPDRRAVPPPVVEMWEEARRRLADREAILDVSALGGETDECQPRLNGAPLPEETVAVAPERSYLLTECVDGERRHRWVRGAAGHRRSVLSPGAAAGPEQLRSLVRQWRQRADLDAVVYIGPGGCGDDEAVCLGLFGDAAEPEGPSWRPFGGEVPDLFGAR